jgi:hypothetical protein
MVGVGVRKGVRVGEGVALGKKSVALGVGEIRGVLGVFVGSVVAWSVAAAPPEVEVMVG